MKIVCIHNGYYHGILTIGKIYDGEVVDLGKYAHLRPNYNVIADNGISYTIYSDRFIVLDEYRNQLIDYICDKVIV
jgi:hypothetical protein